MRTYLDGELLDPPVSTLGEALAAARDRAAGRLVVEVLADDQPIPSEHLEDPPRTSPYADVLRVTTAAASSLVKLALLDAAAMITEVRPRQIEAAQLLQSGRTPDAMDALREILEAWNSAHLAVQLADESRTIESGAAVEAAAMLQESTANLTRLLNDVKTRLAMKDWSALADVLEYDLSEHADRWSELLGTLADGVGSVD